MKHSICSTLMILGSMMMAMGLSDSALAARFANQFIEFEMPPQWQCNLEGAEWVCQNTDESKKKDAIIVLAAKLKGEQDSLDQYLTYLKAAKNYTSVQGKPVKSDPKYAKTVNINGHAWVDALHMESEIPGFYTRYLATVKQDIGALVTYSIAKDKYQQYLKDFETMVNTLKVFRKGGGLNAKPANSDIFKNTSIPTSLSQDTVFPQVDVAGGSDAAPKKKQEDNTLLYVLGGAAVLFLIWKKKRSG